ncbi:hypothetical protein ACET3Z_016677 [Daucus carota]
MDYVISCIGLIASQGMGMAPSRVPKIKFLIILELNSLPVSALFRQERFPEITWNCTLGIICNPVVIHHPKGQTVPRLGYKVTAELFRKHAEGS